VNGIQKASRLLGAGCGLAIGGHSGMNTRPVRPGNCACLPFHLGEEAAKILTNWSKEH
jgi:hypothetical protein